MPYKYKKLRLPDGTLIDEHRFVWKEAYGEIPEGFVIHHKNENARDNSLDNLEMLSKRDHGKQHHPPQGISSHGNSGYRKGCRCAVCRSWKSESLLSWRGSQPTEEIPHGTNNGYVHYKCRCLRCRQAHTEAARK